MKEAWKFTIEKLKKEYKGADITCDNPLTITRKDLLLENNK